MKYKILAIAKINKGVLVALENALDRLSIGDKLKDDTGQSWQIINIKRADIGELKSGHQAIVIQGDGELKSEFLIS